MEKSLIEGNSGDDEENNNNNNEDEESVFSQFGKDTILKSSYVNESESQFSLANS